jgi:hypothetical protein
MELVLLLIGIATVLLWIGRWIYHWHGAARSSQSNSIKRLICAYALVCGALLIGALWHDLGVGPDGTDRTIPNRNRATVQHLGYYLGFGRPFVFGGPDTPEAFRHPALKGRDRFQLQLTSAENESVNWRLAWDPMGQPLRVGSEIVNVPDKMWMGSSDAIKVCVNREGCAELRYQKVVDESVVRSVFSFFHSIPAEQYTFRWEPTSGQPVERSTQHLVLRRGLSQADLIRSQHDWHGGFPLLPDILWDAFSNIVWVREFDGRKDSRLGVLVDPSLLAQNGISVFKNGQLLDSSAVKSGEKSVSGSQVVSFGLAGTLRLNLAASRKSAVDADGGRASAIRELWFETPVAWPAPPEDQSKFILTSTDDYIPIDGYSFALPDPAKPFYAKAQLSPDLRSWTITGSPKQYSVQEVAHVGRISQGAMVRLARAHAAKPAWTGIAAVGFGVILLLVVVWRDGSAWQSYIFDCIWPSAWMLTVTVLTFRFLTAYRMSLVPPQGASEKSIALFDKAVNVSLTGLILIPLAMAFAWTLGRYHLEEVQEGGWLSRVRIRHLAFALLTCTLCAGVMWYSGHGSLAIRAVLGICGLLLAAWLGLRRGEFGTASPAVDGFLLALPTIWTVVAIFFGARQQSFMGLRISTSTHLLTILVVWLFCARMPTQLKWRAALAYAVLVPLALQVLPPLSDRGVLLYSVPSVCLAFVVWLWRYPKRVQNRIASLAFWTAIAVIVLVGFVAVLTSTDNVVKDRFATFLGRDKEILLETRGDPSFDFDLLRRNMLHRWQMLAYSAKGGASPFGFGGAPLSNVGMSYATSMSDSAFSIYVLGEHGRRSAMLLVGFLVAIGCFMLLAIPLLQEEERGWAGSVALLFASGAFFIVNTLYMALANVGQAPFTGQNIPFLSFDSGGDLFQGGLLLTLVCFALGSQCAPRMRIAKDDFPLEIVPSWLEDSSIAQMSGWRVAVVAMLLLVAVGLGALWRRIDYLGQHCQAEFCVDHTLSPVVNRMIRAHMPEGRSEVCSSPAGTESIETAWVLKPEGTLEATGAIDTGSFEREVVSVFNMRPDKYDPGKGYIYLEKTSDCIRVRLNDDYFRVPLPFGEHGLWRGRITARDQRGSMPTICGFGSNQRAAEYCLSLSEYGSPLTRTDCGTKPGFESSGVADSVLPLLEAIRTEGKVNSSGYVCVDGHGHSIFSVQRVGNDVRISGYGGVRILEDGVLLTDSMAPLKPGAVLNVVAVDPSSSQNLLYLSSPDTTLAFTQWRNGKYRRVFPYGPYFPMAYSLGIAADDLAHESSGLQLSLDIRLQEQLLADFGKYINWHREYETNDPLGRRLAAVVMDAFTGEIRALPSWPYADPSDPSFERALEVSGPRTRQALLRNHNFDDHVVGSTVKPLVFSSIASQVWPEDISSLEVFNEPDAVSKGQHLHNHIAGVPFGQEWNCDSIKFEKNAMTEKDFLTRSLDLYEATLGFVGTATDNRALKEMFSKTKGRFSTHVNYKGYSYLDVGRLRQTSYSRSLITLEDLDSPANKAPRMSSVNEGDTLLLKGLHSLFDAPLTSASQGTSEWDVASFFLPTLGQRARAEDRALSNVPLSAVTPEMVRIDAFEKPYPDFILCLLGGGPSCRFNDVWMAQAGARMATGHAVRATLESRAKPDRFLSLPAPFDQQEWMRERLIGPLHDVGTLGTAKDLHTTIVNECKSVRDSDCYLAIYKTGTIDEDIDSKESEALLFVLGLWRSGKFVYGHTLAGFIYMQDSKNKKLPSGCPKGLDCAFRKFELAGPIVSDVASYVHEMSQATNSTK